VLEQKSMARNEIESWLLDRTENIIAKEHLERVTSGHEKQFMFEREAIQVLIELKQQVM
jgi:hypothetical protein